MKYSYKLSDLTVSNNKIEELKRNLSEKKSRLHLDFNFCVEEMKKDFLLKIDSFFNDFDEKLSDLEKNLSIIFKTQTNLEKIHQNFNQIFNDFSLISNILENKINRKPRISQKIDVHENGHNKNIYNNLSSEESKEKSIQKTLRSPLPPEIFEYQENTIVTSPALVIPHIKEKSGEIDEFFNDIKNNRALIKITDDLDDLRRKSSINSYEEVFKRPRAITKNITTEAFAKNYLTELYNKSKELFNILDKMS